MGKTGLKTGYKFGPIGQYGGLNSPIANTSDVFLFIFSLFQILKDTVNTVLSPCVANHFDRGDVFLDFPEVSRVKRRTRLSGYSSCRPP